MVLLLGMYRLYQSQFSCGYYYFFRINSNIPAAESIIQNNYIMHAHVNYL